MIQRGLVRQEHMIQRLTGETRTDETAGLVGDGWVMDRSRVGHVWVMDGSSPLHLLQDVMQRHGLVVLNLLELAGKVS